MLIMGAVVLGNFLSIKTQTTGLARDGARACALRQTLPQRTSAITGLLAGLSPRVPTRPTPQSSSTGHQDVTLRSIPPLPIDFLAGNHHRNGDHAMRRLTQHDRDDQGSARSSSFSPWWPCWSARPSPSTSALRRSRPAPPRTAPTPPSSRSPPIAPHGEPPIGRLLAYRKADQSISHAHLARLRQRRGHDHRDHAESPTAPPEAERSATWTGSATASGETSALRAPCPITISDCAFTDTAMVDRSPTSCLLPGRSEPQSPAARRLPADSAAGTARATWSTACHGLRRRHGCLTATCGHGNELVASPTAICAERCPTTC